MEDIKTTKEFDKLLEVISKLSITSDERIELYGALASYIASR